MQRKRWINLITAALMVAGMTACGTEGGDDQNQTQNSHEGNETHDANDGNQSIVLSSEGIHIATSPKVTGLNWYSHIYPLIDGKRVYLHRISVENVAVGDATFQEYNLSVKSYNVSNFNSDKNLSDLLGDTVYTKSTQMNSLHSYGFKVIHHNLTKRDGHLYFSISPEGIKSETQGGLIKYDLDAHARAYSVQNDAINNYEDDINDGAYFDLTRGWLVPFDDDHIGVVSGHISKVVNSANGSPLRIGGEDYFSGPSSESSIYNYGSPVSNGERYFHIETRTDAGYGGLLNVKYIADNTIEDPVKWGMRGYTGVQDGRSCMEGNLSCSYHNPNYKLTRVIDDFKAKYTGTADYEYKNNEWTFSVRNQNMMIEGDKLYVPFQISLKKSTNDLSSSEFDSYIIEYDMHSNVTALHFIDRRAGYSAPSFYNFTKYGDVVYYIGSGEAKKKMLVAYNLKTKTFVFQKDIAQAKSMNRDFVPEDYILTSDTIILPHKTVQSNDYYYDMAFDVISRADGHLIKRLQHTSLTGLHDGNGIVLDGIISDNDSVYYLLRRSVSPHGYNQTLLVKIDAPNNTAPKEQYRYDPYMSGVVKP